MFYFAATPRSDLQDIQPSNPGRGESAGRFSWPFTSIEFRR